MKLQLGTAQEKNRRTWFVAAEQGQTCGNQKATDCLEEDVLCTLILLTLSPLLQSVMEKKASARK